MDSQERNLSDTACAVQALVAQVSELTQQLQRLRGSTAPPTPPVPLPPPENPSQLEPRLPVPESYTGEPNYCRAFLTRCSMHFSLQPRTFNNERAKVAFVLMLLTGRAALWGTAVWENQDPCCASFQDLSAEMSRVFDWAVAGREAARMLANLRQGERSVSDFSIEFRTIAAESQWNEEAQWDMFLHGLADRVQKEIYAMDLPTSLNDLIALALRVDARLSRMDRRTQPNRPTGGTEGQRFGGRDTVSPVYDCRALLDSGAEGNFMDHTFARKLQVPLRPLTHKIPVHALNGQELPTISFITEDVTLITSGNHTETISFYILDTPLAPIVLGHPWLTRHNPKVDWQLKSVSAWSSHCHKSCLVSACPSVSVPVFQEEAVDLLYYIIYQVIFTLFSREGGYGEIYF